MCSDLTTGLLCFLGLNELVPENLLAIFDENELEVRKCSENEVKVYYALFTYVNAT